MEEPKEFKAKIIKRDGRKELVVQPISEEIKHPNGRIDVIIHVPSLSLISKFLNKFEEENGKRNL